MIKDRTLEPIKNKEEIILLVKRLLHVRPLQLKWINIFLRFVCAAETLKNE